MDIAAIIQLLQIVVAEAPAVYDTAEKVYALGQKFFETVNGRAPTDDEVAALRAQVDSDVAEALQPLPPE